MSPFTFPRLAALAAAVPLAVLPMSASAVGLIGDDLHATVVNPFGTPIDADFVAAPGDDLAGDTVFHHFVLDVRDNRFGITVSKPTMAGNFTAIFDTVVISGIDARVIGARFDVAASDAFSSGDPDDIDLSVPGQITIDFGGIASGNTPATDLSHRYVWELQLAPVPEPGTWALSALGLAAVGWRLRRARSGR